MWVFPNRDSYWQNTHISLTATSGPEKGSARPCTRQALIDGAGMAGGPARAIGPVRGRG